MIKSLRHYDRGFYFYVREIYKLYNERRRCHEKSGQPMNIDKTK